MFDLVSLGGILTLAESCFVKDPVFYKGRRSIYEARVPFADAAAPQPFSKTSIFYQLLQ